MQKPLLKKVQIVFGTLFLLGSAYYLWEKRDEAHAILQAVHRFNATALLWVLAAASVQVLSSIVRTYIYLPSPRPVSFLQICHAVAIGQVLNTFVPARAGDVVKAVMMSKAAGEDKLPPLTAGGVIVADKVIDFASFLLLVLITSGIHLSDLPLPHIPWTALVGSALALGLGALAAHRWLSDHWKRVKEWGTNFRSGMAGVLSPKLVAFGVLTAWGAWALEIYALQQLVLSQGVVLTVSQTVFCLCVVFAAVLVPISFANVGTFEASLTAGLVFFQVASPAAIAIATVHHAMQLGGVLLWGGVMALLKPLLSRR